jgi:hypothetical protein
MFTSVAARASDFVVEPTGGPDVIAIGCPTVMIGVATPSAKGGPGKPPHGWLGSKLEHGLDLLSGLVLFESVSSAEVGKVEGEAKGDAELDLKKMGGKVQVHAGIMAALLKLQVPLKIRLRIPYSKKFLGVGVTVEGTLLSAGAEIGGGVAINEGGKAFDWTWGAKAGVGVGGLGLKGSVDVADAGDDYPHLAEKSSESPDAPTARGGVGGEPGGGPKSEE